MIGYLKGNVISSKPTRLLVDVNGVGYIVNISINTFEKISNEVSVSLFIHTAVKEDSITLYGFYTESEKETFELLISVNGVGPRTALGILSGIRTDDLKNAISTNDISLLSTIPGIGRKTAERLVLELRNKIETVKSEGSVDIPFSIKNEAVLALSTLGYNQKQAEKAVRDVLTEIPSATIEETIKRSLGKLTQ